MATSNEVIRFLIEVLGNENVVGMAKAIKDAGVAGADAEPQVKALTNELSRLVDSSKNVNGLVSLKAALSENDTQLANAKAGLAALSAEFNNADTSSRRVSAAFNTAQAEVSRLTAEHNRLSVQVATTGGALEKAGIDTGNLAAAHSLLATRSIQVAQHLEGVVAAGARSGSTLATVEAGARKVGDAFIHGAESIGTLIKKAGEITGITALIGSLVAAVSGFEFFKVGAGDAADLDRALAQHVAQESDNCAKDPRDSSHHNS